MDKLFQLWRRLHFYLRRDKFERELEDEINLHLELKAEENRAGGMSTDEAAYAAQRQFGNQMLLREDSREIWSFRSVEMFVQDLRYGLRMMWKAPLFTFTAVVALALGIGANTAIFTIVNAVLLRPLPYPQAERLIELGRTFPGSEFGSNLSEPKFVFLHDNNRSFEALMATQEMSLNTHLTDGTHTEYISGMVVSAEFFPVLGISPAHGRAFSREEDSPSGPRVVIVSDGLWRRTFGSDPNLLGKAIPLNGIPSTVVGIMPPGFEYFGSTDVFVPMQVNPASKNEGHNWTVIGRLKNGISEMQARAEAETLFAQFREKYPQQAQRNETFGAQNWRINMTTGVRELLSILLGAVFCVLLIACANVANLQLTRAASRQKEMAIRMSIGGGSWRLLRQLVTEGVLLSFIGGGVGLLLALFSVNAVIRFLPEGMVPRVSEITLDWRVLAFCLGVSFVTGLVFGLAPAWHMLRQDLNSALKKGVNKVGAVGSRGRVRNALVVIEIALALALTTASGLLLRTFVNLRGVQPGFDTTNLLTFAISPPARLYDKVAKINDVYERSLARFQNLPGVEIAAITSKLPLDSQFNLPYRLQGQSDFAGAVQYRLITPTYFRAMKISLRQGREFNSEDGNGADPVAIVNEAFVNRNFAGRNALGEQFCVGCDKFDPAMRRIVGIVNDTKQRSLDQPAPSSVFIPVNQCPEAAIGILRQSVFTLRTVGNPQQLGGVVPNEVRQIDPLLSVRNLRSMDQLLSQSIAAQRFNLSLLSLFSAVGLMLAAIGVYGVMAYNVSQRTHEIGLRMALGAQKGQVLRLVLKRGILIALAGVSLGIAISLALTRLMKNLLFGVSTTDPVTLICVALLSTLAALLACYLPARNATRVDPLIALRYE
jgi:putative ABC transport system permease protein